MPARTAKNFFLLGLLSFSVLLVVFEMRQIRMVPSRTVFGQGTSGFSFRTAETTRARSVKTTVVPRTSPTPGFYGNTTPPAEFQPDNLVLYTRLNYAKRWGETRSMLLPSLQLFWPHPRLVVALDAETDGPYAEGIEKAVANEFPPLQARGVLVADYPPLRGVAGYGGWQRGQLDMMFADKIVKAKYVGLVDSDAYFTTLIAPQAIFSSEGKPIVVGSVGRREDLWSQGIRNLKMMLKKDYVIGCMNRFPVVIATAHIAEMRQYVERVHGKPFLEVYKAMMGQYYCHYSIMCNYVWYFHHDEYDWHYWNYHHKQPGWDAPLEGSTTNFSFLTTKNEFPVIGPSAHLAHTNIIDNFDGPHGNLLATNYANVVGHINDITARDRRFDHLALHGFCYTALEQCRTTAECERLKKGCESIGIRRDKLQYLLFRFEIQQTWEWDDRIMAAQQSYYKTLRSYINWIDYGKYILKIFYPESYRSLALHTA